MRVQHNSGCMTFVRDFVMARGDSRVEYLHNGTGQPLLHIQPTEPQSGATHDLLSQRYRVLAIGASGGGAGAVVDELGLDQFAIWATGSAARVALAEALDRPDS